MSIVVVLFFSLFFFCSCCSAFHPFHAAPAASPDFSEHTALFFSEPLCSSPLFSAVGSRGRFCGSLEVNAWGVREGEVTGETAGEGAEVTDGRHA